MTQDTVPTRAAGPADSGTQPAIEQLRSEKESAGADPAGAGHPGSSVSASYDRWNRALADHCFSERHRSQPAYLAVDDELLETLAAAMEAEPTHGALSLSEAMRERWRQTNTYGPYALIFDRWQRWREEPAGPPPYIALLGLASLAATRMAADPDRGISANNYYRHFNDLIGRDEDGQPPGFDQFYRLWQDLQRWLDDDLGQARGASTVRAHPRWTHIGYPISQCLLREADRRRLTQFFRSVGLEHDDEVSAERLMTLLRGWASRGGALTEQARRVIATTNATLAAEVGEIVKREFDGWDGQLVDSRGRRRADIALQLLLKRGGRTVEARLIPRRPEGFPEGLALLQSGHHVDLEPGLDDDWYRPLNLKVTRTILEHGLSATLGEHAFAYDSSAVVPLRASLELGGWISVPQALPLEEHAVIAHPALANEVRRFLSVHGAPGWAEPVPDGDLPPGWRLFTGVRIGSDLEPPSGDLRRLVPRLGVSMKLEGGLRIARDQYLSGGEPDLWITVEAGQELELAVDGQRETVTRGVHKIRLSERGLTAGAHELELPGQTRRFSTFEGFPQVAADGTGSLAHVLERHGTYKPVALIAKRVTSEEPPRGTVWVRGADAKGEAEDLPEAPAKPLLLRSGFRSYVLIGPRPGEILSCFPADVPNWLEPLGLQRGIVFDYSAPFAPAWVLIESARGTLVRTLGTPPPPQAPARSIEGPLERAWADAIVGAEDPDVKAEHAQTWALYGQAAR